MLLLSLLDGGSSSSSNNGKSAERSVLLPFLRHASAAKHTMNIPANKSEMKIVRWRTGISKKLKLVRGKVAKCRGEFSANFAQQCTIYALLIRCER